MALCGPELEAAVIGVSGIQVQCVDVEGLTAPHEADDPRWNHAFATHRGTATEGRQLERKRSSLLVRLVWQLNRAALRHEGAKRRLEPDYLDSYRDGPAGGCGVDVAVIHDHVFNTAHILADNVASIT